MKKFLSLFLIIISFDINTFAQSAMVNLQSEVEKLQKLKSELEDSLNSINDQLEQKESELADIQFNKEKEGEVTLTLKSSADLYKSANIMSDKLTKIWKNQEVILLDAGTSHFIHVNYNGLKGYVTKWHLEEEDMIDGLVQKNKEVRSREKEQQEMKMDSLISSIEHDKRYISNFSSSLRDKPGSDNRIKHMEQGDIVYVQEGKAEWLRIKFIKDIDLKLNMTQEKDTSHVYGEGWVKKNDVSRDFVKRLSGSERRRKAFIMDNQNISEQYKDDIQNGRVRIGMTKDMVRAVRGYPKDVNRTVTTRSVREQWVYGSISNRSYFYFEDGVMTSFQD